MKNLKKIFTLALVLAMVLSMAVPVSASSSVAPMVGTHVITINQDAPGHTYGAYQIFSGKIESLEAEGTVLTEIQWGTGIDGASFLVALKSTTQNPAYAGLYANATTAADVAKILSENNTSAHARAFADLAGAHLLTAAGTTSTLIAATETVPAHYEIGNLESGYYLVQDEVDVEGATLTDYLLRLVNDVSINPKDGEVTVEKGILEGETVEVVGDFVIGQPINFELYGTLPDNYSRYEAFYFEFHDTMSKGITYDGSLVVEFINGSLVTIVDPSDYETVVTKQNDGTTTLEIKFADLVALGSETDAQGNSRYAIHADTKIYATYKGHLNDDAIVGSTGNPNEVYIEYSNDPNDEGDGHDTTIEDEVHAFTFALDMTKTDGSKQAPDNTLANVGFKLYTDVANVKEYAVVDLDPDNDITDYTVTGWTTDENAGTLLLTSADGTFTVYGLDVGTYYLEESQPLSGYDPIEDLMITITASYNETSQTLTSLKVSYDNIVNQDGNLADGSVDVAVVNNPGAELPSTGGVGTTLFYVFGGLLVCAAVVLLITKKRMAV